MGHDMAKKKKPENQNHVLQLKIESERRRIRAVSYLFPAISALLFVITYPNFLNNQEVPMTSRVIWALALGLLFPARGATGSTIDRLLKSKNVQIEKLRIVYRVFNILSISILALLIFPLIYYSSLPTKLSAVLQLAQTFSNSVIGYISEVLAILLSSLSGAIADLLINILGAFVYDMGKKIYHRKINQRSKLLKKKAK
jgi:hypothetical protein